MHEILRSLPAHARVLDLGARTGSFGPECCPQALIVRLDRELPPWPCDGFVQADAARLPFRDGSFHAVVANHCLEHVDEFAKVLEEIGRIVRPGGSLYVAVPDASTLSDRLYRWVYHGGGHINAFRSADALARQIEATTKLPLVAIRLLTSSLGFLDRCHFKPRPPRRLWLLGNGHPRFIAALNYVLRILDRVLRTRTSVYGWAFYFGNVQEPIETAEWTNVCVSCGAGHSAASLASNNKIRREYLILKTYNCPNCGAWNLFTQDRRE